MIWRRNWDVFASRARQTLNSFMVWVWTKINILCFSNWPSWFKSPCVWFAVFFDHLITFSWATASWLPNLQKIQILKNQISKKIVTWAERQEDKSASLTNNRIFRPRHRQMRQKIEKTTCYHFQKVHLTPKLRKKKKYKRTPLLGSSIAYSVLEWILVIYYRKFEKV